MSPLSEKVRMGREVGLKIIKPTTSIGQRPVCLFKSLVFIVRVQSPLSIFDPKTIFINAIILIFVR